MRPMESVVLVTLVMPGHSRPKDGVACARLCPAIHVFTDAQQESRGWPGQARPWREERALHRM